jgi:phosphatidylethanolamine-binding protein (PEBP) family uncharacterized protein
MRARRRPTTIICSTLAILLAAGGCGGMSSHSTSASHAATSASAPQTTQSTTSATASQGEKVPTTDLPLASPALATSTTTGKKVIAARYTCDAADVSPAISWSHIPANTVELELFIFNSKLIHEQLFPDWAVAGLKPSLRGLSAGRLPPEAIVGRNGFGQTRYSICPAKGVKTSYVVLLLALTRKVPAASGFNPDTLSEQGVKVAESEGEIYFSYKR